MLYLADHLDVLYIPGSFFVIIFFDGSSGHLKDKAVLSQEMSKHRKLCI